MPPRVYYKWGSYLLLITDYLYEGLVSKGLLIQPPHSRPVVAICSFIHLDVSLFLGPHQEIYLLQG